MDFSLIICTFQRPSTVVRLLQSVEQQTSYPAQIIVVDASLDEQTGILLSEHSFKNLEYYKVGDIHRGLTRQRNFGISKVNTSSEVVAFLDDDTILDKRYFEEILNSYRENPAAVGVGGYISNESYWEKVSANNQPKERDFEFDGWKREEGLRYSLRRMFGLTPSTPPGIMPDFSHGYPISYLPPTGKVYQVEYFMGGAASYKTNIFQKIHFSKYFRGYGLYEDMDFCLRASKIGLLFVNTAAQLQHYHDEDGRPNHFKYGQMVIKNGWYVWQVKYPNPTFKAKAKWYATAILLSIIRLGNSSNGRSKNAAFKEFFGRLTVLISCK